MLASILILLSTIWCSPCTVATQDSKESMDRDVYTAVLDTLFAEPDIRPGSTLVLGDSTSDSVYMANRMVFRRSTDVGFVAELFRDFGYVDKTAVSSFEDRHQRQAGIPEVFPSRANVVRVFKQSLDSLPDGNKAHWRAFYEKYPGSAGLVSFSPIGYSRNGDVAIVMVDHVCGRLCGRGYLVGLQRKDGRWHVATIKPTWTA
jgi:hypothetical protein